MCSPRVFLFAVTMYDTFPLGLAMAWVLMHVGVYRATCQGAGVRTLHLRSRARSKNSWLLAMASAILVPLSSWETLIALSRSRGGQKGGENTNNISE